MDPYSWWQLVLPAGSPTSSGDPAGLKPFWASPATAHQFAACAATSVHGSPQVQMFKYVNNSWTLVSTGYPGD